ncbi:DUF4158 domain-containing protein [Pseudarthrobacter sp. H2]|uniref:DUF4158 domain-containing protein n=1 Tax=Pseudarthrobacter sp. H2 TaxID=3418415 RepID=UPI003CF1FCA1
MAVDLLSDEQAAGFGRFPDEVSREDLERFWWLDDTDLSIAGRRRLLRRFCGPVWGTPCGTVPPWCGPSASLISPRRPSCCTLLSRLSADIALFHFSGGRGLASFGRGFSQDPSLGLS